MTNDNFKPIFKKEPNIPKTYEQFILEEQSEQDQKNTDSYQTEFDAYGDIRVQKGYGPCRNRRGMLIPYYIGTGCFCSKEKLLQQLLEAEKERDSLLDKLEEYKANWEEYKAAVDDQNTRRKDREEWQKLVNIAAEAIPVFGAGLAISDILEKGNDMVEAQRFAHVRMLYNKTVEKYNEIRSWYNRLIFSQWI